MATSTDTSKLAPRILVNEHDISQIKNKKKVHPITLIFGFAPVGKTCEMVECNNDADIYGEFGFPTTAPEKYFIDSASRIVHQGVTVLMTRLPYDNDQSHKVKYVDYKVEDPIALRDIATIPAETKMRKKDNGAVSILKELHGLDDRMTQVQRISQISNDVGEHIHSMTNQELIELELDPQDNLDNNTFRIVDIRGEQYGMGAAHVEYTGIFPMIVSAPLAMYYQGKIETSTEYDDMLKMVDLDEGVEMSTAWFMGADPVSEEVKVVHAEILESIHQRVNVDTTKGKFDTSQSFQDKCAQKFPGINIPEIGKLDRAHMNDIGVLVCRLAWDSDLQETSLEIVESFVGKLGRSKDSIDRKINTTSKYIRMYKNISIPVETDFFIADHQKITSLGMNYQECQKYINYKTSIIEPITYILESVYSDVDSIQIDTILDAGLSSTAFAAYVARNAQGETFKTNEKVRTRIDWAKTQYKPDDQIEDCAFVWNQVTKLFGDFIKNVRGDCVYIADGPRILNLERNYPIKNYTDMQNIDMFNRYLPYFNGGNANNYVARYWNWVYIEDLQYENRGLWVPGSVVMGSQLAENDISSYVWFAPAGHIRGIVQNAYDVSVKTKQYNSENDLLYSNHWNFFNIYQNTGVVVDGQKTMQTKKTSLDRLNVRRMVCWIKQQVREIANRYKYEPNTATIRAGFRDEIVALLQTIKRGSGISDFVVVCDDSNNSVTTIDRHELYCKIGIKPIKAIEYIVIDIDILNGNVGFSENTVIKKGQ